MYSRVERQTRLKAHDCSMWATGDWKGDWGSAPSSRNSSAQGTHARPSPSTDGTSLYDVKPYHPQPAHTFYVDQTQGGHISQAAHAQYTQDPRLHGNGYMQQAAPYMQQGFGSGGGYYNPAIEPCRSAKLPYPSAPPGLAPPPRRRVPAAPPVLQRIPQIHPSTLPTSPSGRLDAINPMWTHIYPPEGASAYGHPTIVNHNLQPAVTIRDPDEAESSSSAAKRHQIGLPPGLPISQDALDRAQDNGHSLVQVSQSTPLDKYAPTYIPQWLKLLPAVRAIFTLPQLPPYPSPDYAADILPRKLLRNLPVALEHETSLLFDPPIADKIKIRPLDHRQVNVEGHYSRHFSTLLALALRGDAKRLHSAAIYKASLVLHPSLTPVDLASRTYRLTIPGIREDFPRLQVGDVVILRGLSETAKSATCETIEARVTGMIKIKGWVFISAPFLGNFDQDVEKAVDPDTYEEGVGLYNVTFMASTGEACTMQNAVRTFGAVLDEEIKQQAAQDSQPSGSYRRGIAHRWLFPLAEDVIHTEARETETLRFLDPQLNQEQMKAVLSVAHLSHGVPYIISGPPGTGKTRTLVEGVMQILHADPEAKILVVAPSNPAADTLASRLAKFLTRQQMLRLCSPARTFAEVPNDVLPYCFIENNHFGLPPAEELLALQVVVCNCMDAGLLVGARLSNLDLMRAEHTLMRAIHPVEELSPKPHWTHLLVDEAAQGTEPVVLIPMSVVLPYTAPGIVSKKTPVIVLVGDCHQLGPVITSARARDAEFDTSLLERLINRDTYSIHDKVGKQYRRDQAERPWCSITNLVQNYRSIAPILMVPSSLFYEDQLVASATNVKLLPWRGLPNPELPIAFLGCEGDEECIEDGASWYNEGEVAKVLETVQSLLNGSLGDLQQNQVAVITTWREQTWRLRAALRAEGYRDVNVGDVESYQGAEYRVTILSCVRSRERFVKADKEANMGFINEPKRFNVAITRAKELLIVIGNANLLKIDPYWQGFLQVCLRNNLYVGPEIIGLKMTGAYLSRLESQLYNGRPDPFADLGLLLSAEVAREVLRE